MPSKPAKKATVKPGQRSLADLLAAYPPNIQMLARQTKRLILDVIPRAEETVDGAGPYVGYGYGPGYKGLVAALIVSQTGVKIGLSHGARLFDPHELLAGAGKVHRHIAIRTADDLSRPGVRPLVEAALVDWKARQAAKA